jgi:hypothetical protein
MALQSPLERGLRASTRTAITDLLGFQALTGTAVLPGCVITA